MGASQSKADNEQVFYNPVPIQVWYLFERPLQSPADM